IIRPREIICLLLGLLLVVAMIATGDGAATAAGADDVGAFSKTKTVTREFVDGEDTELVDTRDVTVKVDHTVNLRGRERVKINWSGARPSAGRAADPAGEKGMAQEYPVVIMQCRGQDNPSLPAKQQMSQKTCWTSTVQQRSQSSVERNAVWRHDPYATEADRDQTSGLGDTAGCEIDPDYSTHATPFIAATGKTFAACSSTTMPPEAAVGAAFPPAEVAAFTSADGTGEVNFEVRSATENESLGCSSTTPCSIVVIPIMGLSCADTPITDACEATGSLRPGSNNFSNEGVDAAVSPVYWWSESNWRNRITVPLTFGLAPDACDVLDSRAPTAFYGSELMSQAALQWSPAYCLRKDRFKFQLNRLGDDPAFALVEKNEASAAFVSDTREKSSKDESFGYAPTAVTGFAISYVIDEPDNAGEREQLRMTPRLIAKMLTQSYAGSELGRQHPGMGSNPVSLNLDPEFRALNPGLDSVGREAGAALLSLSESSDVIKSLTSYIANDKEAMAFVNGAADPWGMVVNPTYKKIALPTAEFPLLDTFVPTSQEECRQQNPGPYFSQLAAPVTTFRKIAEAVLDAWPNTQTRCDRSSQSDPYKTGRLDRQGVGTRFMLGVVSLGDASRFGLRTAALQTRSTVSPKAVYSSPAGRTFVGPTGASLTAAASVARQGSTSKTFDLGQARLAKRAAAYPGTMIVYTAAKTRGLDKAEAKKVASFIRISTTEGQVRGSGNGKLPDGYVPIRKTGATAALYEQAQKVADLVEAQKEPKVRPTKAAPTTTAPTAAPVAVAPDVPAADAPAAEVPAQTPTTADTVVASETVATAANTSGQAQNLLPVLLGVLLAAGLGGPATRLVAEWRRRR
ncbi:MAG: hypothetical protein ABWX74_02225, partial [Aeromicrobium sp.]